MSAIFDEDSLRYLITFTSRGKAHQSAASAVDSTCKGRYDLLTFLGVAQKLKIDFLPITWEPALDTLGSGATAHVRQALVNLQMSFAFKHFKSPQSVEEETTLFRALVTEILVLGNPTIRRHPHVVDIEGICWDVSVADQTVWPVLVHEKAPFGDLLTFMTKGCGKELEFNTRLELCFDVSLAIRDLHAAGIVHGDIKPENILVFFREPGGYTAKVTDFGYSTLFANDDDLIRMPWSGHWTAPEWHHRGFKPRDAVKMDTYSFGMVCAWLLFYSNGERSDGDLKEITRSSSKFLDHVLELVGATKDLSDLQLGKIKKMLELTLASDPDERTSAFGDISHLLIPAKVGERTPMIGKISSGEGDFRVLDSICQFMHSHYIVRNAIVKCLEKGYREGPTKSIALNLALCGAIGFGIGRDNEKCKSILMDNAISDEDFEHNLRILEQISELEYNYQKGNFRVAHRQGYILNFDVVEPQLFRQQFGKAERQYRREVADLTSAVGFDHYLTSIAKRELASILNYAGRYEDAAKLRLELVGSAKKMFGDDNLASQMVLLGDLARTYRDQGLLKEAEALQLQAVKAVSQLQGSDHRHTLLIMADLATTYRAQSRTDKAEALQREIVEKSLRALGRDHVETLSSIANLSSTLRIQAMSLPTDSPIRQLRLDEAEELQLQVLETSLRVVGDRNPTTIVHMSNLAATYDAKHQWQKAEPVWVQVLDEIVKTRGADHPEVLPIKEHLAINLAKQNRLHEAELLQRQVLDLASELLEPTDMSLQQHRIALAMTLAHQGRWSEAEILRSQIVRTRKETRGDELPWLLDNMTALAALFWTHGRDSEAQELQVCTAEVIRRIYGPESTATINAEKLLSVFSGQAS